MDLLVIHFGVNEMGIGILKQERKFMRDNLILI